MIEPQQMLARANKQLKALNRDVRRFVKSRAYQLGKSTVTGEDGTIYVEGCQPIPESIPMVVGDICNDHGSALDQILWQLWVKEDPAFDKLVSFPICDTGRWFKEAAPNHIGGLPSQQQAIFEGVQPYKRGNKHLSILRELNSADKHRLNPVVSTTSILNQLKFKGMVSPAGKFKIITRDSDPPPLEVGTELVRVPLEEFIGDFNVNLKFKYWQVFGKFPEMAEGLLVVDTLTAIRDEVKKILKQFRPFLKG